MAEWVEKAVPILLILESLVILSNIFFPTTFYVDGNGVYYVSGAFITEDIYLIVISVITTILIIRSESPHNQKVAALTFIFLPLTIYLTTIEEFGNASQYGMILMSLVIWIGILEISTGKITCANAGHEYPAIYHDGKFRLFKDIHGFVLGSIEGARYREYEIQLEKGDKIFVYTDGVPEATNANAERFGIDRMMDVLNANAEAGPKEVLRSVRASADDFVGTAEQFDDLTMACLEYRGSGNMKTAAETAAY